MDIIYIEDLKVQTTIGVFVWEQAIKQTLLLNLELATDAKKIAANDKLPAVDYGQVVEKLRDYLSHSQCFLIETLAERIAQLLIKEFAITWLRLKVRKPGIITNAKEVGIMIERKAEDYS